MQETIFVSRDDFGQNNQSMGKFGRVLHIIPILYQIQKRFVLPKKVGYTWKFFDESDKMEYFTNPDECATLTPERNLCGTLQGRDGRGGAP